VGPFQRANQTLSPTFNTTEFIPGYTLRERIGCGGYGEVWKVEAPGGLLKAVKFVYGRLDEERASRELKALGRIREVRHPFILSLERIEVLDGQLVVVTELAEGSLRDRYDQCRAEGLPGIPRDELLGYLRDAADALDFMCESFSLQHLDVKPENLLLIGHRVKVADFGLVKDMQDTAVSLMGGLTPHYAAPELFSGNPSLKSDQYSLAIVYEELLTSVLPFSGRSTAQLATQHMHGRPRLGPLPPSDRQIVARGLMKVPEERFPNCRALVDSLLAQSEAAARNHGADRVGERHGPAGDTTPSRSQSQDTGKPPHSPATCQPHSSNGHAVRTMPLDSPVLADHDVQQGFSDTDNQAFPIVVAVDRLADWPMPMTAAEISVEDLPPLEIAAAETTMRPTLFLGVGGTAIRALRRLRQRWSAAAAQSNNLPRHEVLLIDTDPRAIGGAVSAEEEGALDPSQTLWLPLKKPAEYLETSEEHSRWLHRRWLCNLPHSQRTEGLRPLGRLAFVDHRKEVVDRLHEAITQIATTAAGDASGSKESPSAACPVPQIFLVASLSGGTGSGMVFDLAYAIRKLLAEMSLPQVKLWGLLAHSTPRQSAEKMLAELSTCAALRELHYFNLGTGMPDASSDDAPGVALHIRPFDDTYLVHLGDELSDVDFHRASGDLGEYLYLATSSAAGTLLEHSRIAGPASPDEEETLRSFSLSRPGFSQADLAADTITALLDQAMLRLGKCGGRRRAFVVCPDDTACVLPDHAAHLPIVAVPPGGDPLVCCEIEGLPISRVAAQLIKHRLEYARLARRLHTRIDLPW
jgi:eukaryotic-like serine/threonine-protein kinase